MARNTLKKIIALILIAAVTVCGAGCTKESKKLKVIPVEMPVPTYCNPLTGEAGYQPSKLSQRIVSVVVENHPDSRPQWAIETPDITMEAEVEGGITRMLWLYADYKNVPSKVGPVRSARPSYVKFSKFFDAVYIHWGGSHSKDGYVGGYDTIINEGVDDIDGMLGGKLFTRDYSRGTSSEHTGVLVGDKLASTLKDNGIRTTAKKNQRTKLLFNTEVKNAGSKKAEKVKVTFSNSTDTRVFTYNTEDKKYHTGDWGTDVNFQNVVVLMDNTTYITVPYKGSYTSYLNYSYDGGTGYYASNGTIREIRWSIKDGKIKLKRKDGKAVRLNPGRSYIGLASDNHGGEVSF